MYSIIFKRNMGGILRHRICMKNHEMRSFTMAAQIFSNFTAELLVARGNILFTDRYSKQHDAVGSKEDPKGVKRAKLDLLVENGPALEAE